MATKTLMHNVSTTIKPRSRETFCVTAAAHSQSVPKKALEDVGARAAKTSTLSRLLELKAVFSLVQVKKLGLQAAQSHTFIARAIKAGLIASAGQRSGIYYNLLRDPAGPTNRVLEAALMLYPSSVVVGLAIVHDAHLTTQIARQTQVAILNRRSNKTIDGVIFVTRTRSWYQKMHAQIIDQEMSSFGIAALTPEAAIEDGRMYAEEMSFDQWDLEKSQG